jgi:hypothetical protein
MLDEFSKEKERKTKKERKKKERGKGNGREGKGRGGKGKRVNQKKGISHSPLILITLVLGSTRA